MYVNKENPKSMFEDFKHSRLSKKLLEKDLVDDIGNKLTKLDYVSFISYK